MAGIPRLRPLSTRRRLALGALLGLGLAAALALLRGTRMLESLELQAVDLRTRHFASARTPDPRILLMQVEESDVEALRRDLGQPWPWPLEVNGHLVRALREAGAAALMVDVLHLDRGAGPDDVAHGAQESDAVVQQRELEAADAQTYGAELAAFGRAALGFELSASPRYDAPARRAAAASRLADDALAHAGDPALVRDGVNLPVSRVAAGAALLGFTNTVPDPDGVVRRAAVLGVWRTAQDAATVLSLPLATARVLTGAVARDGAGLHVGSRVQRLMDDETLLVNHHAAAYPRVAPAQVLAWALASQGGAELPPDARAALEGRIVVLGVNLPGLADVVPTALGTLDGPAFQATVLDNLLHGDGRVRAGRGTNLVLLAALALAASVLGALLRGRWLPHLVPLVLGTALTWAAYGSFAAGTSLDLVTPVLALLLAWGGTFALRALTEGRRNKWLEGTFGRYMAPPLIEALKRDPARLELGGRTREVTVLFSDVAGFTRFSERLAPPQVVRLLNRYLTAHCEAVMDVGGVVDKFEGDAVMAFFGDPVEQPDHAERACRAALCVQDELPALRPLLDELGLEGFAVRVGLNGGPAVVGNMGSAQRFSYTCMGDTVNLASRLEGAAKAFGARILVGEATAAAVARTMLLKPLGRVRVVGREEPVAVHELLAEAAGCDDALRGHAEAFARALGAARAGDLPAARTALAEAHALRPGDGPCAWFAGVLEHLDGPWPGLTVLQAK